MVACSCPARLGQAEPVAPGVEPQAGGGRWSSGAFEPPRVGCSLIETFSFRSGTGLTTTTAYDAAGRQTGTAQSKGGTTLRSAAVGYDANGNATSVTDYATPPHTTTYGYDAAGRVTRQVEPGDGTTPVTTTFGYDAAGNRTRLTDGRGNATWYTFNTLGLPESTIEPATATAPDPSDRTWTTAYDKAGQAVTATEPGGVKQTSAYDALGRVTSSTATGAGTTTGGHLFTYDLAGRMLTAATDAPATPDTFTYNDRGQLLTATGPSGTSSYTYDDAGQMTAGTSAAGTATYAYDNAGQLTGVAEPLTGAALSYHYDQDGNPDTVGYGTGKDTRTFGYDDLDRLTSDTLTTPGGATVAATTYGYDRNDQLTTKATTGTAGAGTDTYTYDPSGRLSSWTRGTTTTDYGWDASGNLVKNGTTTADYDEQNHRTGDSTGATYTYTPRGTLTSVTGGDHPQTYTYDAFDRMTAAGATAYTYDALDRLTTRGGAHFTYAGASTQIATDGSSAYTYDPAGPPRPRPERHRRPRLQQHPRRPHRDLHPRRRHPRDVHRLRPPRHPHRHHRHHPRPRLPGRLDRPHHRPGRHERPLVRPHHRHLRLPRHLHPHPHPVGPGQPLHLRQRRPAEHQRPDRSQGQGRRDGEAAWLAGRG